MFFAGVLWGVSDGDGAHCYICAGLDRDGLPVNVNPAQSSVHAGNHAGVCIRLVGLRLSGWRFGMLQALALLGSTQFRVLFPQQYAIWVLSSEQQHAIWVLSPQQYAIRVLSSEQQHAIWVLSPQ
jgi:hypothetical protein